MQSAILTERKDQVIRNDKATSVDITCDKDSAAGAISQRACVFCGSRVVLYPIADAVHLVHGPIGCAVYTWDIRGALSSGPELHRLSFSTDIQEIDVIFGGETKLYNALIELIERHKPKAAFVYSTCIVGIIGDDLESVCKKVTEKTGISAIPVQSEGFKGNKRAGYIAACNAMARLVGTGETSNIPHKSINILGDFNLAGEIWMIRKLYEKIGITVVANITGDGRVDDIRRCHGASLNVVQCSGATMHLANMMEKEYGIPSIRVSYFGIEDMADSIYAVADYFNDEEMKKKAQEVIRHELAEVYPKLQEYKKALQGKKAAIYVGGAFKAFSLVKAFRLLGMDVVMVGSQTGTESEYRELQEITDEGTIIADDSNPLELSSFLKEKDVDIFVGGVKERPIAYKLGVAFCDHNHERKEALAGFTGMLNFAQEVYSSVLSPVWKFMPRQTTDKMHVEQTND